MTYSSSSPVTAQKRSRPKMEIPHERHRIGPVSDALVITWRNLKRIPRIPELAIFAVLQSIMFVLLFAYVFGGAIPLPDGELQKEFLMPGIFVQTIAFASATTAIGIADDMGKGLIDRFRSLPMARSAVLTGRTIADVIYQAGILVVLMLAGLVVGWRVNNGFAKFVFAVVLLLAFCLCHGLDRRVDWAVCSQY